MAPFGLSALKLILQRKTAVKPQIASWSRPYGLGRDKPYTERYASNLAVRSAAVSLTCGVLGVAIIIAALA